MLVDGYEGGDEVLGWDFAERDFRTKEASATNAMYLSIVPGNERRVYQSRSTYNSLSGARVVLCGDDDKSSGKVEATIEASKNSDGTSEGRASLSIEHTTSSGLGVSGELGANLRQDKDGNVQTGVSGKVKVGIEY